jgi:hypothetical protein
MVTKRAGLTLPDVFFGSEVTKFKEEAHQKGRLAGFWEGAEFTITAIHEKGGYSAEKIAEITGFLLEFVQSTIEKCEKKY